MAKKIWTPAARAAFARKMKAARAAKHGKRAKNPKRRVVKKISPKRRRKNPGSSSFRMQIQYPSIQGSDTWITIATFGMKKYAMTSAREWHKKHPYDKVRVVRA